MSKYLQSETAFQCLYFQKIVAFMHKIKTISLIIQPQFPLTSSHFIIVPCLNTKVVWLHLYHHHHHPHHRTVLMTLIFQHNHNLYTSSLKITKYRTHQAAVQKKNTPTGAKKITMSRKNVIFHCLILIIFLPSNLDPNFGKVKRWRICSMKPLPHLDPVVPPS